MRADLKFLYTKSEKKEWKREDVNAMDVKERTGGERDVPKGYIVI
jgi:hypothetical protein